MEGDHADADGSPGATTQASQQLMDRNSWGLPGWGTHQLVGSGVLDIWSLYALQECTVYLPQTVEDSEGNAAK